MQATLPVEMRQSTLGVVKTLGIRGVLLVVLYNNHRNYNTLYCLGMYTGTLATLARDVPFSILFFPGYANIKKAFADERGENSLSSLLFSGGIAGAIAAGRTMTYFIYFRMILM